MCEEEEDDDDDDDRDEFKEGKVPMTPELFRKVCMWLLVQWGIIEGIFGALFLVLTWNLDTQRQQSCKDPLQPFDLEASTKLFKHP